MGKKVAAAVVAVLMVALSSCAVSKPSGRPEPTGKALVVGYRHVGAESVVAEIYAQVLRVRGFNATAQQAPADPRVLLLAVQDDIYAVVPVFSASLVLELNPGSESATTDEFVAELRQEIDGRAQLSAPSTLRDDLAYAVAGTRGDLFDLADVADLPEPLVLAAPARLSTVPDGLPSLTGVYRLTFASVSTEESSAARAAALMRGKAGLAAFTLTDPALEGLTVLEDSGGVILPDAEVALLSQSTADSPTAKGAIDDIQQVLSTADVRALRKAVDAGTPAQDVVAAWLATKGLA